MTLVLLAVGGCSADSRGEAGPPAGDPDAGALPDVGFDEDGGIADSGLAPAVRGPLVMPVDGDPNGLFWDTNDHALYLADDNGNRILKYTDADGLSVVGPLPTAADQGPGLGQLVRLSDGAFVIPRFGYGTMGDIAVVRPGQAPSTIPGLDATRRRIGIAVGPGDALYGTFFVNLAGNRVGSVTHIELTGTESEIITGLQKPVGVLVVGDRLYVSDQDKRQILYGPVANPNPLQVYATLNSVDLLSLGPGGDLYTGSKTGEVYRITTGGAVSTTMTGLQEVRGTAYDPEGRRLFIADHDGDSTDGTLNQLHIIPVDQ